VWISQLDVVGWRNHERSSLKFQQGVNVLVGSNGQGKTNIVEAVRYLATLGSHRVSGGVALIADGAPRATIFAALHHDERTVAVGITLKRSGSSEATVSGNSAKVSEVPRWVSAVMFAPEDIAIVRGEPGFRRQFLDELVIGASPAMAAVYGDFDKVLKQRNSLLKSLRSQHRDTDLSTLEIWNSSFVNLASQIIFCRVTQWRAVLPHVTRAYEELAGGQEVTATYTTKGYDLPMEFATRESIAQALTKALEDNFVAERERGVSLIGPQRDELELMIAGLPARTHASQGETWSLALSLRLGSATWLREERSSGDPIMILDDVFAELDARRRTKLVALMSGYEQLIVTSAVEKDIPSELSGLIFDVVGGQVSQR
jgi:DNA replication and repair protein RecF